MPKVIVQIYPSLGGPEAMAAHRPIGRDADVFHSVMHGLREIAVALDQLGYWGLSHVEHHFHSEGLEMSPDPGLWNLYLGQYTQHLRHGQLGFVLPARDPLRLAEKIAMIDHMLEGRLFVGIARGYQTRWMNVLGQRIGVGASRPDREAIEARNRELYFEHYRIMKLAWANDLLQYKSRHYEAPYPYDEGIEHWPPAESVTRPHGVPGEVDENGVLQGISVVPKCYQQPHPPIFQPFSQSRSTVQWAAREGLVPITMFAPMILARWYAEYYQYEAGLGGRELGLLGENMGLLRSFSIHKTRSDAQDAIEKYDMPAWRDWYGAFGHLAGFRYPDETGDIPAPGETVSERLTKVGLIIGGTVDDVKRQIEAQLNEVPFEYLVWHLPYAVMPKEVALEQIELFASKVMPEFGMSYAVTLQEHNDDLGEFRTEWHDVISRAIARAWVDEAFKAELIADPTPWLHAQDLHFPTRYVVEFYDDPAAQPGEWHSVGRGATAVHRFPIPPAPDGLLTSDIALGLDASTLACCCPCASCCGAVSHTTWR